MNYTVKANFDNKAGIVEATSYKELVSSLANSLNEYEEIYIDYAIMNDQLLSSMALDMLTNDFYNQFNRG